MYIAEIAEMQAEHKVWVDKNFPNQVAHHGLLGMVEELGELSHSHLKREQGIRGTDAEHTEAMKDALGDIFIFMLSYANTNGFDVAECIEVAWSEVMDRDWQSNPETGVTA